MAASCLGSGASSVPLRSAGRAPLVLRQCNGTELPFVPSHAWRQCQQGGAAERGDVVTSSIKYVSTEHCSFVAHKSAYASHERNHAG